MVAGCAQSVPLHGVVQAAAWLTLTYSFKGFNGGICYLQFYFQLQLRLTLQLQLRLLLRP